MKLDNWVPISDQALADLDRYLAKEAANPPVYPEFTFAEVAALREKLRLVQQELELKRGFYGAMEKDWELAREVIQELRNALPVMDAPDFLLDSLEKYARGANRGDV